MSDLISRSALLERMRYRRKDMYKKYGANDPYVLGFCGGLAYVEQYPGVDAVPVVHARWSKPFIGGYNGLHAVYYRTCSNCSSDEIDLYYNYCPNCGAKMDGGAEC